MSHLRIALVANNIHFRGGMERYCAELATRLCLEHDVHLFASEVADVPFDRLTVHPVRTVKKPILALFLQFYWKASRQVKLRDFDIVHTIGGITAQQNIVTAQYCQYAWGEALRTEAGASEGVTAYHQFMWRLAGYFEKRAMTGSQTLGISANSARTSRDLQKFYGSDPGKIRVIHNAVDAERFTPKNKRFRSEIRRRLHIPEEAIVVLFVGEYRRKGLATVIRALGLISDPRVHLLAVGKGDLTYYNALAAESGIKDRTSFVGPMKDIEQVFGAADLFVFPTFYEAFGMVITEAMASGLPVVTSRDAGAAEMIEDGMSGLLVDQPGNVGEVQRQIEVLLSNSAARLAMGEKARQAASAYTWADVATDTLSLYHDSLARHQSAYSSARLDTTP
jgi:UDP-glucose:(heptosyl)LPS alpha-1,3-glucosyltransferase